MSPPSLSSVLPVHDGSSFLYPFRTFPLPSLVSGDVASWHSVQYIFCSFFILLVQRCMWIADIQCVRCFLACVSAFSLAPSLHVLTFFRPLYLLWLKGDRVSSLSTPRACFLASLLDEDDDPFSPWMFLAICLLRCPQANWRRGGSDNEVMEAVLAIPDCFGESSLSFIPPSLQ